MGFGRAFGVVAAVALAVFTGQAVAQDAVEFILGASTRQPRSFLRGGEPRGSSAAARPVRPGGRPGWLGRNGSAGANRATRPRVSRAVFAQCLLGVLLPAVCVADAGATDESSARQTVLAYATDRAAYTQGDVVRVTVTNVSGVPVTIVDRAQVDGGFAGVERLATEGRWQTLELLVAANVAPRKTLQPGARHQFVWPTVGYARAEAVAPAGTYRIRFGEQAVTNEFEVRPKPALGDAGNGKGN